MKLSELVFRSVKNTIYFDDTSFSFLEFKKGTFNGDPDYALNLNNVYAPLNEAISRLSDLEKIPYQVLAVKSNMLEKNIVDLKKFENEYNTSVKEVVNVGVFNGLQCEKVPHYMFGHDKVVIEEPTNKDLYIEFKQDIPYLDEEKYHYVYDENGEEVAGDSFDVDLKEYGITDSMCNYIMEYVKGNLGSVVGEEVANMHLTRAEQYFNNIQDNTYTFGQKLVKAKCPIRR